MRRDLYDPMLAFLGNQDDIDREGYIYEPKLDGTRALCYVDSDLRFINRRGHDITERYPEFLFRDCVSVGSCVLDGEIVVYDDRGNTSFSLLQKREQSRTNMARVLSSHYPATYIVFDILELEGMDITLMPLEERRLRLHKVVSNGKHLQTIVATRDGHALWSIVETRKLEGIMAKRIDSFYEPGKRSRAWIKIKALNTVDCVIIGFTSEERPISALALGLYFGEDLRFIGRVGTGFTEKYLEQLRPVLDGMVIKDPPVKSYPNHPIIWTRPELVAEIEYLQLTRNGHLRAPSFRRLRYDKDPKKCTSESVGIASPEK